MEYPLLDTSVFSTYKKHIDENFDSFHFSIVVFYELMASTIDESALKKYEYWQTVCKKQPNCLYQQKQTGLYLRKPSDGFDILN